MNGHETLEQYIKIGLAVVFLILVVQVYFDIHDIRNDIRTIRNYAKTKTVGTK